MENNLLNEAKEILPMSINAVDFVTLFAITEGEEVVALYGRVTNQKVMIPIEGKKK